jgi:hypothetical protein
VAARLPRLLAKALINHTFIHVPAHCLRCSEGIRSRLDRVQPEFTINVTIFSIWVERGSAVREARRNSERLAAFTVSRLGARLARISNRPLAAA